MNLASNISFETKMDSFFRRFKIRYSREAAPIYVLGEPSPRSIAWGTARYLFYDANTLMYIMQTNSWDIESYLEQWLGTYVSPQEFFMLARKYNAFLTAEEERHVAEKRNPDV